MKIHAARCIQVVSVFCHPGNRLCVLDRLPFGSVRVQQAKISLAIGFDRFCAGEGETPLLDAVFGERDKKTRIICVEIVTALTGQINPANVENVIAQNSARFFEHTVQTAAFPERKIFSGRPAREAGQIEERVMLWQLRQRIGTVEINEELRGNTAQPPSIRLPVIHGSIPL